ncbi:hypothetical protein [Actinoplanes teichomyceticus]|uniref:Uncharacterized protein n=1 Tax=Actinoplanes teichomyceticus TaxID=1867 RepID=A0A561VMA2_ACTTI|nr:hypothetical protein [Actinoplanes teichomyceticus]TWG12720.1 hypothetical protein FHX34_105588 [Actinoplanes teichomyceticus]GIF13453.1 hypothetical protein Ate01nite_34850 [Actinoplanes teichomyceticus]
MRHGRWIGRAAFAVIVIALVGYLVRVGLARADMVASSVGAVVALASLGASYLFPAQPSARPGAARATGAGAVAVAADNEGAITTEVSGTAATAPAPRPAPGVTAAGPGSVAVGGANRAPIRTRVARDDGDGR